MLASTICYKSIPVLMWLAFAASAQIAQDHPALCGQPDVGIPVPPGVTAIANPSHYSYELSIKNAGKTVLFPGIMESVQQVCPLNTGELLVFGLATPALYNINKVRLSDASLLDSFLGFDPVLAPNHRWLVRRKFYPAQAVTSEEYLLYDAFQDWSHNRSHGSSRAESDMVGSVIYPVVAGNRPFYNVNLPPAETHTFRSDSFYWAPDSGALAFADSVLGRLSLVLVSIDQTSTAAYVYPLSDSEACNAVPGSQPIMLSSAEISPPSDGHREIQAGFRAGQSPCGRTLTLQSSDFKPAAPEVHTIPSQGLPRLIAK